MAQANMDPTKLNPFLTGADLDTFDEREGGIHRTIADAICQSGKSLITDWIIDECELKRAIFFQLLNATLSNL